MLSNHDLIENDMNNKNKLDKKIKKNTKMTKKYKNKSKICCNNYKPNTTNISYTSRIYNTSNTYDINTLSEPKIDKIIVSFSFN